jgi:hypothetical protein
MKRNSGSILEPAMIKRGANAAQQCAKMTAYPSVFAPIHGTVDDGYVMPMMGERAPGDTMALRQAFQKLETLWKTPRPCLGPGRDAHHTTSVVPLLTAELQRPLVEWYYRARPYTGRSVNVVHGDATLENIMMYNGYACWIDPSTRPMPLEAEFDVAKVLQTQFGYNGCVAEPEVTAWARTLSLRKEVIAYYLMTHLVRLYRVQPQARLWAANVAATLENRLEDVCKS